MSFRHGKRVLIVGEYIWMDVHTTHVRFRLVLSKKPSSQATEKKKAKAGSWTNLKKTKKKKYRR